jgi:hypothetical protein
MCSIKGLITNGLLHMADLEDNPEATFTQEYVIFCVLVDLS